MKSIQFTFKEGNPQVVEVERPTPADDEVLVRVVSAAIDTATPAVLDKGSGSSYIHALKDPLYLGWHFSGIVESIGEKVNDMSSNQEVWGFLQYESSQTQGSFSEYIVVKANACAVKPPSVSHEQAAASATEALTALQAMRDNGGLSEGKSVLVIGAGGSVGIAAVSIAKQLAASVTAVCSTKDLDRVKEAGADEVVDRKKTDVQKLEKKFDVIFDTPGSCNPVSFLGMLNDGGAYVRLTAPSLGFVAAALLTLFSSKKVAFLIVASKREDLDLVGSWLESGDMKTPIDSTFMVRDMQAALDRFSSKEKTGRVVIQVEGGF